MTDVTVNHPKNIPYVELIGHERRISFPKECFGSVQIYRKVNGEDWQLLVRNVRTPFTDNEKFSRGSHLYYSVNLDENGQEKQFILKVRV